MNFRPAVALSIVGWLSISSPSAIGIIHVERICDVGGNPGGVATLVATAQPGAPITIDIDAINSAFGACRATFRIRAADAAGNTIDTEAIGRVTLSGAAGNWVRDVIIAPADAFKVDLDFNFNSFACSDWGGLDPGPYVVRAQAKIKGALTDTVRAARVARISAGSISAAGDITHDGPASILQVVANTGLAGDVVATTGNIEDVISNTGDISGTVAATVGTVFAVRAPQGTISGSISSARGRVDMITARNITGTITANGRGQAVGQYWAINLVEATESIGSPTQLATITTTAGQAVDADGNPVNHYFNAGILKIIAKSIHANITTPIPELPVGTYSTPDRARGDIRELITTGTGSGEGVFRGSIATFTLGEVGTPTDPLNAVLLKGPLLGAMNIDGTIKRPARFEGGIASTGALSLLEQDQLDSGAVIVTGNLDGHVEIAGNNQGLIRVENGNVNGMLMIGKSVRRPNMVSNYTGRIEIANGSLAASGTVEIGLSVEAAQAIPGNANPTEINVANDLAGSLKIGRSLIGDVRVGGSLSGQVIVNANNSSSAPGVWSGNVTVGSTTLSTKPYYSQLSTGLGGGAVGLAPFNLYSVDCTPPHDPEGDDVGIDAAAFNADLAVHAWIRFYGPIRKINPSLDWSNHVQIFCRPLDPDGPGGADVDTCGWFDATAAFEVNGPGEGGWNQPRALGVARRAGYTISPGVYRVSPVEGVDDAVQCDQVMSAPGVLWPSTCIAPAAEGFGYIFAVTGEGGDCALADFNGSGSVTVQDLFDFLAAYFANDPAADVNASNTITVQDIFDYLADFFGCQM